MKILTASLLIFFLASCGSHRAAIETVIEMEAAAVNNNQNLKKIIDAQADGKLNEDLNRIDTLHTKAVRSITVDGQANVNNLAIVDRTKAEQYQQAMHARQEVARKVALTDKDMEHIAIHSKGLQRYFKAEQDKSRVIDEVFNQSIDLLERYTKPKESESAPDPITP